MSLHGEGGGIEREDDGGEKASVDVLEQQVLGWSGNLGTFLGVTRTVHAFRDNVGRFLHSSLSPSLYWSSANFQRI